MTATTIDIASEVKAWVGNFEMLKSFSTGVPADVMALRTAAIQAFERLGFPTTKHEEWKYTSLHKLVSAGYAPAFRPVQTAISGDTESFYNKVLPRGLRGTVIVLVNGHFDATLSTVPAGAVVVNSLRQALAAGDAGVLAHYGHIAEAQDRALVALNTAIATDGVSIRIPKNTVAEQPIVVVHLACGDQVVAHGRTLIQVEAHAAAKVVELWHNWDGGSVWENHVSEIVLGDGAQLELVSVQNEVGESFSLTHFAQVHQAANSTFRSAVMSGSGHLIRNDLQALHLGQNCTTYLNGLTLLDGESHVDHHTLVDHAQPHCYSNETYKSVLDGHSTCVFNGKVMVRPDAQKTNAFQSNKTLLLSEGATVNTKPQLEIFADDVKCSHGATTGQLDETALFYMRSRGLSAGKARALLTYAFGAEVLEQISIPEVRTQLETYLLGRLGGE
jgi:Fe-S cluster assembly protein SufD